MGDERYNRMDDQWVPEVRTNPSRVIEPTAPPVESSSKEMMDNIAAALGWPVLVAGYYPGTCIPAAGAAAILADYAMNSTGKGERGTTQPDDFGNYYGAGKGGQKVKGDPQTEQMVGRVMRARGAYQE